MNEQSPSEPEQTTPPDPAPAPSEPAPPAAEAPAVPTPPATEAPAATTPPAAEAPAAKTPPAAEAPAAKTPPAAEAPAAKKTPAAGAEKARAEKAPTPAPGAKKPRDGHWWWGLGRRKAAVARVRLRPGDGKFVVNKRPYDKYLTEERDRHDLMAVLHKTKTAGAVDVHVTVRGGGYTGQAGAIVLGLGRALLKYDDSLESILRDNGFLTRDPRKVERKKYGQPGARKRFQFSKR
ncbi:MAG: 30S ribosomal protein S9 [Planctomycetota bacterium]|jgi:small subunit ribosomal protein S9